MENIGKLIHQQFPEKPAQQPVDEKTGKQEIVVGNSDGEPRCRFDLFVRYPETAPRRKKTFCYRGDFFGIADPDKMLWSLVRMVINKRNEFVLAELYDNTKPKDHEERTILRYKNQRISVNRLQEYEAMLKDHPLPEWLKQK